MTEDLKIAQTAALAGAEIALQHFAAVADLPRELKADGSVVTVADRAVETAIRAVLGEARPDDAILGEEHGATGSDSGRRWIIDPIDGTALFVEGDDRWLVLVALEEQGAITAGVAVVPARSRVWWAALGSGAYEGGLRDGGIVDPVRISVAGGAAPSLDAATLGVVPDWGREPAAALIARADERPWPLHPPLLVARGDLDLAAQTSGQIWDFAATSLIVAEAGGVYAGFDGNERPGPGASIFARSRELRDEALKVVTGGGTVRDGFTGR
ncbi:histidinol-phosphatase [Actinoplanes lutulentus]|uniref:Histidinol-phosphatase n=1 Tax=Actinoplanes lutulentus TaxID=1287878 RepID=A0A327ZJF5_9ACTN|nr:inositol monophosphatase family protein [Actinoplanes lutulentus]MBB2943988.1 histidinol-phosphatase [Actinoplanes lutulentus]RAK42779.1 histidinol-phosphatase [Actinoplanes lutulentus]